MQVDSLTKSSGGKVATGFVVPLRKDKSKKHKKNSFVKHKVTVSDSLYGGCRLFPIEGDDQWFDLKVRHKSFNSVVYDDSFIQGEVDANGVLLAKNPDAGRSSILFSILRHPSVYSGGDIRPVVHTIVNYEFPCVSPHEVGQFFHLPYSEVGIAVTKRIQMFILKKLKPSSAPLAIKCLLNMYRSLRLTYPNDTIRLYSLCVISVQPGKGYDLKSLPILTQYDIVKDRDIELYETVMPPERPSTSDLSNSPSAYMLRHYICRMPFAKVCDAVVPVFHLPFDSCKTRNSL